MRAWPVLEGPLLELTSHWVFQGTHRVPMSGSQLQHSHQLLGVPVEYPVPDFSGNMGQNGLSEGVASTGGTPIGINKSLGVPGHS